MESFYRFYSFQLTFFIINIYFYLFISISRNAYRVEVASFLVPVAGEDASAVRLRERIEFSSNILFFVEDLYLALGPGHVTTQAGSKINVVASLLWIRNQHASNLKDLMIAKKTGWSVLRNFKNQVFFIVLLCFLILAAGRGSVRRSHSFFEPLEGFDFFDVHLDNTDKQ